MSEVIERILAQEDMNALMFDCLFEMIDSVAVDRFRKTLCDRLENEYGVNDFEVWFERVGKETVVSITSTEAHVDVKMTIITNPVVIFE